LLLSPYNVGYICFSHYNIFGTFWRFSGGGLKFTFGFNGGQLFQCVSLLKKLGKGASIWGVKKKIEEEGKDSKWGHW
jgi:hypothetical protein